MSALAALVGAVLVLASCAGTNRSSVDADEARAAGAPTEEGVPNDGEPPGGTEESVTPPTNPPSDQLETSPPAAPRTGTDDALPTEADLDALRLTVEDLGFGWTEFPPIRDVVFPCGLEPAPPGQVETAWANFAQNQQAVVGNRLLAFETGDQAAAYVADVTAIITECDGAPTPVSDDLGSLVMQPITAPGPGSYSQVAYIDSSGAQVLDSVLAYVAEGSIVIGVQVSGARPRDPAMDRQLADLLAIVVERVRSMP